MADAAMANDSGGTGVMDRDSVSHVSLTAQVPVRGYDTTKVYLRLLPGHLRQDYDAAMPKIAAGL